MVYTVWLCYIVLSILKTLCSVSFLCFSTLHFSCCFVCRRNEGSVCSGYFWSLLKQFPSFLHLGMDHEVSIFFLSVYLCTLTICWSPECMYLHCAFAVSVLSQKSS